MGRGSIIMRADETHPGWRKAAKTHRPNAYRPENLGKMPVKPKIALLRKKI
jgi:hypothetical protein